MMTKEKRRQFGNKLLARLLTILGFSSTFAFMACYGPPPEDLEYVDVAEEVDSIISTGKKNSLLKDSTQHYEDGTIDASEEAGT